MSFYQFSINADAISLQVNNTPVAINTADAISMLTIDEFKRRFIADIIKDALIEPKVDTIDSWIDMCFPQYSNPPIKRNNYLLFLHDLDNRIFLNDMFKSKETTYKNIIKLSTLGYTKISDADMVFWESGFSAESLSRPKMPTLITTAASLMDPLPKPVGNKLFPSTNDTILFDSSFTNRLGFPTGVTWSCKTLSDVNAPANARFAVEINYGNGIVIRDDNVRKNAVAKDSNFQTYSKGNSDKNSAIIKLASNPTMCPEFKKYVITKEFGDVAQVFMYLAFILLSISTNNNIRTATTMITTDSVVYMFCAILNLSCIYTGTRQGVKSGACTLRYFLAGEINYKLKLYNMMLLHFERITSNNTGIRLGLNIMGLDLANFTYFRLSEPNGTAMKRTYGSFSTDQQKKVQIQALFQQEITAIEARNTRAQEIYNRFSTTLQQDTNIYNDTMVTDIYNEICAELDVLLYPQIITKLKNREYSLNPSPILSSFAQIVGVFVPQVILSPTQIVSPSDPPDNNVQQGGANQNYVGGRIRDIVFKATNPEPNGYYESLILVCMFIDLYGIDNASNAVSFLNNNPAYQDYLSVWYDLLVSNTLNNKNDVLYFPKSNYTLETYISLLASKNISDDDIYKLGSDLQNHCIFFPNYNEIDELNQIVQLLQHPNMLLHQPNMATTGSNMATTRSHANARGLQPNTAFCDFKKSLITNIPIPQGYGIYLNNMCFNILELITFNKTRNIQEPNEYLNPYTMAPFSPEDKVRLKGIIEYYRAHKILNFGGRMHKVNTRTTKKKKTRRITKTSSKPTKTKRRRITKRVSRNEKIYLKYKGKSIL